jgi:uncharacterized protein (TIGR00251 family)
MPDDPITVHPDGVLVRVWVVPGASRSQIDGVHGDRLKIRIAAPPEDGRANRAVTRLLEARLGVPVELVGGAAARKKLFLAHDIEIDDATRILSI